MGFATLADDYVKLFRYKEAIKNYTLLIDKYSGDIDASLLDSIKDDFGVCRLIADYPPQTIERNGPIQLKTDRSKIGTIDATLTVNGVQAPWILDTGADFSVVTASLAQRLGVKPSSEAAHTKGGTNGIENTIHLGLLPELKLGGVTIRNIVLLIFDDESLRFDLGANATYQINGILGYPVFQSLGAATFTSDGHFVADAVAEPPGRSSRLFMNKLTLLVEGTVEGRKLLFALDTGADRSRLTQRFYKEFPDEFRSLKTDSLQTGGAGGITKTEVYRLPQETIQIGGQDVILHNVPALPFLLGTEIDDSYGNLGRDITEGFDSFTVDFTNMRFKLGNPLRSPDRSNK